MAIKYHPKVGQILMCDFSNGFKPPEIVKKRPVIVLTPSVQGRNQLVTVVALSSTKPDVVRKFHHLLNPAALPQLGMFANKDTWVKGDMIYSVGFHRLDLIKLGKRDSSGRRIYFDRRLGREQMAQIYSCVLHGINLGHLSQHL